MTSSALAGWLALGAIPLAALSGFVFRRWRYTRYVARMRPHYVAGYLAVALAAGHTWTSAGSMAGADGLGIWLATAGLAVMLLQLFFGISLQAPGAYRSALRRWHGITFWAVIALAGLHVVLNGPSGAMFTGLASVR